MIPWYHSDIDNNEEIKMTASTFNAITYANKLKKAGLDIKIADVQAEEMSNFITGTLATKEDLRSLEYRIIIKVGVMMIAQSTLLLTIIGLLLRK